MLPYGTTKIACRTCKYRCCCGNDTPNKYRRWGANPKIKRLVSKEAAKRARRDGHNLTQTTDSE